MEGESHLNLRWDDHTITFVHLLDHFRLQELYCDASLACAGGGVYPVHKVVLSACSEFFASIFASASCQNPVVVLQDVAREHLEALLTYVYSGEVLLARPALPAFLKVAESLQVKGLAPPPLIPLPRDTWDTSDRASPPHDAPRHTPTHPHPQPAYTQPDPPQYPHPNMVTPPPARCGATWEGERVPRSGAPLQTPPRARGSSQGDGDSLRPPRKRFSPHFVNTEQFGGTFQNLVASEEGGIKEEPVEEGPDFFDTDRLTIYEKEEQDNEEEEMEEEEEEEEEDMTEEQNKREREKEQGEQKDDNEVTAQEKEEEKVREAGRIEGGKDDGEEREGELMEVKIMLDTRQHPDKTLAKNTLSGVTHSPSPSLSTHSLSLSHHTHSPSPSLSTLSPPPSLSLSTLSPTPAHHARSPTQPHNALSPTPAHPAHSPVPATPPFTTSQLRRELLKPLQYRAATQPHHAIPHPVIASRDEGAVTGVGEGAGAGMEAPREPPPLVKISSSSAVPTTPLHQLPHHYRHHHHHHPFHQLRQSDGRDTTTATSTTTPPFTLTTTTTTPNKSHHLLVTTLPTYRTRLPPLTTPTPPTPAQYLPNLTPYKETNLLDTDAPLNLSQDTHHAHRGHHRHRNTGTSRGDHERHTRDRDPFLGKILTNRKRRLRGPKSWEYLVRLLRDPSTNPSLIRWENEVKGVFRLVQPAVIAQRWGRRTGKHASECLSYENFARGLRYHYATGALEPVSERSFVYKFGPKAQVALGDGEYGVNTTVSAAAAMTPL